MLDQNTDRMWYVIGVIVIGGLILTSSIVLFTDVAFASVQDSIVNFTKIAQPEHNLLTVDNIRVRRKAKSNLDTDGTIKRFRLEIFNDDVMTTGGIEISPANVDLKENTRYLLSYSYQKVSGELLSFGGHIDKGFNTDVSKLYLNGELRDMSYASFGSAYAGDNNDIQHVELYFETDSDINNGYAFNHLWIQPNRGSQPNVAVNIYNLKLVEVDN